MQFSVLKYLGIIIYLQLFNYPKILSQTAEDEAVEAILAETPICDENKVVQCGRSCSEYYVN